MKQLLQTLFFFLLVTQICFAQWVQTNGPVGPTTCFAVSGFHCFAGTTDRGVFLSTNKGTSWTAVNAGLTSTWVSALAVSGVNVFAGTKGGIFLSTNNGASWISVNTGLTYTMVFALAVSGTNLFAGTSGGVFFSTNNGTSWTAVGLSNIWVTSLVVSGTNLFAGTHLNGIFLSTNNGTSWTAVNTGLTTTWVNALAVSGTNLFAGISGGVFLSTNNGTNWTAVGLTPNDVNAIAIYGANIFAGTYLGVFLSTNNGTNWTAVNTGLIDTRVYSLGIAPNGTGGADLFAGTGCGVFISVDNGTSWTVPVITVGNPTGYVSALGASGAELFAGIRWHHGRAGYKGEGMFHSTDNGETWMPQMASGATCFAFSGTNLFAGTYGGVFLSTNNGTSWTSVGLTNEYVSALTVSGTNLFAATWSGVFLSTNNGTSWTAINNGLPTGYSVTALAIIGTNLFAGTTNGVFHSTNNGTSWVPANGSLPVYTYVLSLAVKGTNLFAGTSRGVFVSTNNGTNWVAANEGLPKYDYDTTTYIPVTCFASFEQSLFAGTSRGVYFSINNGISWTAVNTGLTDTLINTLAVSGTNLFAGTGGEEMWGSFGTGVWKRPLSEMIVPVELTSFTVSAFGNEVMLSWSTATELNNYGFEIQRKVLSGDFATVAFVKGQGTTTQQNQYSFADKNLDEGKYFYRLKQIDYDGQFSYSQAVEVDVRMLNKFSLEQNYPNPFNPTTTIGYVLQERSNAKLTMLNSLGEEIAVLVNDEQDKGYHKVEFDATKLTSGVYFYQLLVSALQSKDGKAGSFVETKKMLLLR